MDFFDIFSKISFHPIIQMVFYSHWNLSTGKGSDYLFHCLFLDNILLFGWESGDGNVEAEA